MKRLFILVFVLSLPLASCSVSETNTETTSESSQETEIDTEEVFYATLENTPDTKVYVDENVKILWNADDRISIFNKSTSNQAYQFQGESGASSGYFKITPPAVGKGSATDFVCAVYPYRELNSIDNSGTVSFTLPEIQTYKENSFGEEANAMVSVSNDNMLKFKNVGGYLVLKFYGEDVAVSSIKLEGNNHEKLSGEATLTSSLSSDWVPTVAFSSEAGESITLTCDPPVELGAAAEEAKVFWMVVPPAQFAKGFKLTVKDVNGNEFVKTAVKAFPIERNQVRRIVPLEIVPEYSIENEKLTAYLDAVDANPYNPADYTYTYMTEPLYKENLSTVNRLDWPSPATVSWTNPVSGNTGKTVFVYNDKEKTDLELSVEVGNSSATTANVYNLIPGRVYYYSVMNGDSEISKGKFRTTGRRRMMKVGDSPYGMKYANNCRDFGGQITQDGKMIKYGKIYRGSNMDGVTEVQKKFLKEYMGVALDVDLRGTEGTPGAGESAMYDALGFGDMHTTETYASWSDLSDIDKMSTTLNRIFSAVAEDKVVYIHCKVGADRTGYVCMLLEALLGISQSSCDVDYEITSFSGAVDYGRPRTRTGIGNYYYLTKNDITQGVDFINGFAGATFQDKAINYVVNTLNIPLATITAFQNNMLE